MFCVNIKILVCFKTFQENQLFCFFFFLLVKCAGLCKHATLSTPLHFTTR